ncbi:GALR1 protein, partial [Polypterus senegalus]
MELYYLNNRSEELNFSNVTEDDSMKLLFGIGTDNFITLLIFGLIFTLGVLGNSLVITVLARSKPGKPRSTTNIFILNLSIADLSYLLFCIPFQSTVYMLPTWVLGAVICKFIHYFFTVSMLVSIFTLSAMSVDRYIAIVHSRKSSVIRVARHALIGVIVIWIVSLAMAAPVAYHQNIVLRSDNNTYCWEVWPEQKSKKIYVVCTFVFGYVLPLILISFCYAKLTRTSVYEEERGSHGNQQLLGIITDVDRFSPVYLGEKRQHHKLLRNRFGYTPPRPLAKPQTL